MNVLYRGDALNVFNQLPQGQIQLVYLDPPWFGTADFDKTVNVRDYLQFIADIAVASRRVLCETGLIVIHPDPGLMGNTRLILDQVFGRDNFRYEAILPRRRFSSDSRFGVQHQALLFYSKADRPKFFSPLRALTEEEIRWRFTNKDKDGMFRLVDLTNHGDRGYRYQWRGIALPVGRSWRFSENRMDELAYQGRLYRKDESSLPRLKQYVHEAPFVEVGSVWDDVMISPLGNERTGFIAQQSLTLLERVIQTTSEDGDVVLDPFCGSGSAMVAASKLGRKWIGADLSEEAIQITASRLQDGSTGSSPVEFDMQVLSSPRRTRSESKESGVRVYLGVDDELAKTGETPINRDMKTYDFFISHASEDKDDFVRPLAIELEKRGFRVWYDEFSLTVGDSLSTAIDQGLADSRFGIVVLSSHFFQKGWTRRELNGLTVREIDEGKLILPVWHKVSKDEVLKFSPTLADKVALNSSVLSITEIVNRLAEAL